MIKCLTCAAKIPASKVEAWSGKCPRCRGMEQSNRKYPKGKYVKGYVKCKGCAAMIPASVASEWSGKCPQCRGVKQEATFRKRAMNQFSSLEEFQASK
jgi:Zn finger protein HypA/HybF involved in hydrogenase expression